MKQTITLILLLFVFNLAIGQKDDGIKIPKIEELTNTDLQKFMNWTV